MMLAHAMWDQFRFPVTTRLGCLFHHEGEVNWYDVKHAVKGLVKRPCDRRIWQEVNQ